jgi:uncharacterized LabA/DUF88 family protein
MTEREKVIIFIDGSNHYNIIKDIVGKNYSLKDFNFEKFINYLTDGRKLVRVYYYTAPLDKKKDEETYKKQQQFFESLKKISCFNLILCRMQKDKDNGTTKYHVKEDDIHIAVDMVKYAYNDAYDTAILVSSDGDFVPAIEAVKERGKNVENIGFETKFSWHLKQKSDKYRQISINKTLEFFH